MILLEAKGDGGSYNQDEWGFCVIVTVVVYFIFYTVTFPSVN